MPYQPQPLFFGQIQQSVDFRPHQSLFRKKSRFVRGRRPPVPWTNVLADVATKQMMPDPLTPLLRDRPAQFDGRVRDALSAIQNVGSNERVGGTGIQASGAGSASVRRWCVVIQRKIGDDAAEKKPGSSLLIDDAGVLSEPPDAGI